MKIKSTLVAAALAVAASTAFAQGGGNNAQTTGAGAAPATGGGMSASPAQRGTPGGMMFDDRNTPGWGQMNAQERETHRTRMGAMKSYGECQTYMTQHGERMKGRLNTNAANTTAAPGQGAAPANDPCGHLPRG